MRGCREGKSRRKWFSWKRAAVMRAPPLSDKIKSRPYLPWTASMQSIQLHVTPLSGEMRRENLYRSSTTHG